MTRPQETDIEKKTREALLDWLRNSFCSVNELPRVANDKPDMAFCVDGQRIACESTATPDETIYSEIVRYCNECLSEGVTNIEVIWPKEPHIWVQKAIQRKNAQVCGYVEAIQADAVWLLLHPVDRDYETFDLGRNDETLNMAKFGAKNIAHLFSRIFVWSPTKGIQQIYPCCNVWTEIRWKNLSNGYPIEGWGKSQGVHSNNQADGLIGSVKGKIICVAPEEPQFKNRQPNYIKRNLNAYQKTTNEGVSIITIQDEPAPK